MIQALRLLLIAPPVAAATVALGGCLRAVRARHCDVVVGRGGRPDTTIHVAPTRHTLQESLALKQLVGLTGICLRQ